MDIIHDIPSKAFVLPLENGLKASVTYTLDTHTGLMRLIRSEVPEQLRGHGIGKELVEKTFEKLTEEGYQAEAVCSYIKRVASHSNKWSSIIGL